MTFKRFFVSAAASLLGLAAIGTSANADHWFQHSAISPDGKTIVFSSNGDLYRVSSAGGAATPLTVSTAWEGYPVFSRDGKTIAFASDRHGNMDVFVMPASGGAAKRLTFHSAGDTPSDFSADGKHVLFQSNRMDTNLSSNMPRGPLDELYEVAVTGGTPTMLLTTPASEAKWDKAGKRIIYREEKALESDLRKHDVSSFARDIWLYDVASKSHTQLTKYEGGDHNPLWGKDGRIYYTSEASASTFNIWSMNDQGADLQQITKFKQHPVRDVSVARDGQTMAFVHHGDLYTLRAGRSPKKLAISIAADGHGVDARSVDVSSQISDFSVSADGKEVAFVARGEVFVTSADFRTTRQITHSPEQERSVDFAPDGRSLVYAAERNGKWHLRETTLDEDELYFYAATKMTEKILWDGDKEAFQPQYSPDGKKVAFIADRDAVKVVTRDTGEAVTALDGGYNYSYADGDISFDWAPDSQWLTVDFAPRDRLFLTNIAIVPADGSEKPRDISLSGYGDVDPRFHRGGAAVVWASNRYGERSHGSWGSEADVMISFLTAEAYDDFTLSKEERKLKKELEKKQKEDAKKKKAEEEKAKKEAEKADEKKSENKADGKAEADTESDTKADEKSDKTDDPKDKPEDKLDIDWARIKDRTMRLTRHSSELGDFYLTKDGTKLYYFARFEGGYDLWLQDREENSTKLIAKMGAPYAAMDVTKDGKTAFVLAGNRLLKVGLTGGKTGPKPISLSARMTHEAAKERAYMFEHVWRQVADKFYNPNMHGIDWPAMKKAYGAKVSGFTNNRDFARMMEEMLGELNASHTGAYYRSFQPNGDRTASLGLFLDFEDMSDGIKVTEVLSGGPFDRAESKMVSGAVITAIDGVAVDKVSNIWAQLNQKSGNRTRISFTVDGESLDEVIKPINWGYQNQLLYQRWVENRRALVDELSGGKVGYVHVRGMNDASFRQVYSDLLGLNFAKESVIVDTRWNGGGWLHNDLAKLLSGEQYFRMKVRGRVYKGDPLDQWQKPSIVVMGEGNYSDAYMFPYAYKELKIGELVGMPVPGTGTAVWWETLISGDIFFGIPQVGVLDNRDNYLENQTLNPDHLVKNLPEDVAAGRDPQIAKAVELMLAKSR